MGKNKQQKKQSGNDSEKWKNRLDTALHYTGEVAKVAGTIIMAAGAYKNYKNPPKNNQ